MNAVPALLDMIGSQSFAEFTGKVIAIGQGSVTASGPLCAVGEMCEIGDSRSRCLAEVVSVNDSTVELLPLGSLSQILPGAPVRRSATYSEIRSGDGYCGRAVDGFGSPIDGGRPVVARAHLISENTAALSRTIVRKRVATGFRAIDGLLPIAQGQRIGIFAASGVGKTTLVEQLSNHIDCDHVVACLIGERGREVERLWDMLRTGRQKDKVTLVAATSDESASARVRAMEQALAIADFWRSQGKHVVLFVDSITRLAMALREIGLAAGEPPSVRSYTPNVFAALPGYVERCGALRGSGAITAILTVLSETDNVDDPIVETMKSILDGHIVLSRELAEKGHYPAINIASSVSRVADELLGTETLAAAAELRKNFAEYEAARAMIESGIYQAGSNSDIDRAIALQPNIAKFLRQTKVETGGLEKIDGEMARCVQAGAAL